MNVWTTIWTNPRAAIREAVNRPRNRALEFGLLAIGGVVNALSFLMEPQYARRPDAWVAAIVGGIIAGILGNWLVSWAVAFVGRKRGGNASTTTILRATAWSNVIAVWIFPAAVLSVFFYPGEGIPIPSMIVAVGSMIAYLVGMTWLCFTFVFALAEVQGFNVWKAATNIVLASLLIAIPVIALIVLASVGIPFLAKAT